MKGKNVETEEINKVTTNQITIKATTIKIIKIIISNNNQSMWTERRECIYKRVKQIHKFSLH